jgi:hypothetical protein
MALEVAWLLGNDDLGVSAFKAVKPGADARTVAADDVGKLYFHSSWDRIERIHQAGTISSTFKRRNEGGTRTKYTFPTLPYRPIVTVRRRSGTSILADEWWTVASFGDDPYSSLFLVASFVNHFSIHPGADRSFDRNADNPLFSGATYTFDYIVWKIPGDSLP